MAGPLLPKGAPADIVAKVATALGKTLQAKDLKDRQDGQGPILLGGTQKQYVDCMHAEGARVTSEHLHKLIHGEGVL